MGKRGPKPTLTTRDKQVLIDLYMARLMNGVTLQKSVFGCESRYAQQRLRTLAERGYISSRNYVPSIHDSKKSFEDFGGIIYELTDVGVWEAEKILEEQILTGEESKGSAERLSVPTSSVSKYLKTAETYVSLTHNDEVDLKWMPHFLLRHSLKTPDFMIPCLAAIRNDDDIALLFGVEREPHLSSFRMLINHVKFAEQVGIQKNVLMCPDEKTLKMANNFFKKKTLQGELYVMSYDDAQKDLPFVMSKKGYYGLLVSELRKRYGKRPVVRSTGHYFDTFEWVIEYEEGRYGYLLDVSTGNMEAIYDLLQYTYREAENQEVYQKGFRVLFVLVRDQQQLEWLQTQLDNHSHVRLIVRQTEGEFPWFGSQDGSWYPLRRKAQQQ